MLRQPFRLRAQAAAGSIVFVIALAVATSAAAQPEQEGASPPHSLQRDKQHAGQRQAALESALIEMLSGATLEGSYTSTGPGRDPRTLSRDKYTLGDVRKVGRNLWLIPARIQYADHDVTLPVTVPIHWAADTPVIVVDNQKLPPFGAVSARVMFFDGHYAGWWKHGDQGGHLFGVIRGTAEQLSKPDSVESGSIDSCAANDSCGRRL